jgi:hypothetical protein
MSLIYEQKCVQDQWFVTKTIPVFQNIGANKDIKNYRPITNLYSTPYLFEKSIVKQILEIQDSSGVKLLGTNPLQEEHAYVKIFNYTSV